MMLVIVSADIYKPIRGFLQSCTTTDDELKEAMD
jgi:hypothetical protein